MHPMELLGEWVVSNLISIHLDTVLVSVQDRCIVCAKHTIGLETFLDAQVQACFGLFRDSTSLDAR